MNAASVGVKERGGRKPGKRPETSKVPRKQKLQRVGRELWRYRYLYVLAVPMILFYLVFVYTPMYGLVIAFKDYSASRGIWASEWVGLQHFQDLFGNIFFERALINTLLISLGKIVFGFPVPVMIALLLNELKLRWFKGLFQNIMFIPYFLSWVVFAGILGNLLNTSGLINGILQSFGQEPVAFLADNGWFLLVVFLSDVIRGAGWECVIYLAALTAIDPQLYEAAEVDGASRWKQMLYVTLPGIMNTIVVLLILRVGYLMFAGFEQIYALYSPIVYPVADILDTFVYRTGIQRANYSLAAAAGLFQGLIGLVLLFTVNKIAKRLGASGLF
ncbi:protein lplB [Paenibacillus sp. 598K]|uniref:ABC transporter permease n=1 Tax=Paenibacillus sp. 598K TaxID=1117987 RepID=UPI000FF91B56|nr:ABC transporter permease subunit [Paenibacillus sp. 598K]GBF75654.1 protein lplB [Paenibacillus sp. 598K]